MKRAFTGIFLLLLISFAGAGQSLKQSWANTYRQIGDTFAKRDMKPFIEMLDPHYFIIEVGRKRVDHDAFIKNECDPVAAAKWVRASATPLSVRSDQGGSNVVVEYIWIFSMPDPDAKDKLIFHSRETATDYWHKSGGKWLMTKTIVRTGVYKRRRR